MYVHFNVNNTKMVNVCAKFVKYSHKPYAGIGIQSFCMAAIPNITTLFVQQNTWNSASDLQTERQPVTHKISTHTLEIRFTNFLMILSVL